MLKVINLPDKHPSYEHFFNELHLTGCGNIIVVWNIEKILASKPKDIDLEIHTIQELRTLINFEDLDTPTAKAMGFLFLRPLHCRKDFSFT